MAAPDPSPGPMILTQSLNSWRKQWGYSMYPCAATFGLASIQAVNGFTPAIGLTAAALGISTGLFGLGYRLDGAGTAGAWSALYLVSEQRRKRSHAITPVAPGKGFAASYLSRVTSSGAVSRKILSLLCLANVISYGTQYALGSRREDEAMRLADPGPLSKLIVR